MNVLLDNLDLYASAFVGTMELFLVAAVGSIVGGLLLAAMRVSPVPVLRVFGAGYVNIVRNTPLTLVFFFFAFAYPRLEIADLSFFARACLALIVYTSAFVCEVCAPGSTRCRSGRPRRPGHWASPSARPSARSSCPRRCARWCRR